MTLYRQLLLLLWFTMVISLAAVLFLNVRSSSESLQIQSQVNTESALTSLGMRLAPLLEPLDKTAVEVTLNAAFDGAFYRRMSVDIFATEETLVRENRADPEGVPGWFINLFDIEPALASAPVASGWTESAEIRIEGHPGFVQQQLWQLSLELLALYGSLFVVIALIGSLGVRVLIRPLRQIEHQAQAIEDKDFSYRVPEPRTQELKRVVFAMNRLSDILNERFTANARQLKALHQRLQQDEETGVANRQHLLNELEARQAEGEKTHAFIALRQLKGETVRKSYGYPNWLALIQQAVGLLRQHFDRPDSLVGRISEYEFGVLVPVLPSDDLSHSLAELSKRLSALQLPGAVAEQAHFSLAGTLVESQDGVGSLLTRVDTLLREVDALGVDRFVWSTAAPDTANVLRTGQAWVELLRRRIADRALTLSHQPVVQALAGPAVQSEVYVRLLDESGQEMRAGAFLPVIEQFNLGAELDLAVLDKILQEQGETPLVLNLSLSSMRDTGFISRLAALTAGQAGALFIEFPESHLQREPEAVDSFVQILRSLKLRFGIDNVAGGGLELDYVARLRPDYVKIAPAICRAQDDASLTLLTGVCNTVHNLAIPVYATVVESEQQLNRLQETGIDGFQGYINEGGGA
ncbi:EAL domain-containing protein [Marinobacterium arenosum]|uniref:EAL domain-containing protein n=1 Tax=Marinobacterium arenosum TaxID=2862496 RepID=UPI001C95FF1B|nr:EAL domain-containing protein [Marinobacterium arenosum]MBY4675567.1 EAL domain-containing protein [Marinobacterium arenosum]